VTQPLDGVVGRQFLPANLIEEFADCFSIHT
jgi:hypothetical protein